LAKKLTAKKFDLWQMLSLPAIAALSPQNLPVTRICCFSAFTPVLSRQATPRSYIIVARDGAALR
jgi:hypothetical protein